MDLIAALVLSLTHPAPAEFHTPVKHIPIVVDTPSDDVLARYEWGQPCSH